MAMFDVFKRLFGRKKKEKNLVLRKPSIVDYTTSVLEDNEHSIDGRRGHAGRFEKEVARRRKANKVARKSRRINRQRGV